MMQRGEIRKKYNLKGDGMTDFLCACCCMCSPQRHTMAID
jgi:hypothetical protein